MSNQPSPQPGAGHVLRITSHPTSEGALLVHAHHELADFMGRYPYARWSPADKAYLLHAEALPGLTRHAEREQVAIVDQRQPAGQPTGPATGVRPVAQECRHCAQPGSWSRPPARCPGCGRPWDPVPPPADPVTERRDWATCPGCGHGQAAHWAYCSACGHPMPEAPPPITRPAIVEAPRQQLDEPLPLATTVDQVLDHLAETPETAATLPTPEEATAP